MMSHNDLPLRNILKLWMRGDKVHDKLINVRIEEIWDKRWGHVFNRRLKELRFHKGTLYIHVNSSVLRHELELQKELIRHTLNEQLNEEAIKKLIVR